MLSILKRLACGKLQNSPHPIKFSPHSPAFKPKEVSRESDGKQGSRKDKASPHEEKYSLPLEQEHRKEDLIQAVIHPRGQSIPTDKAHIESILSKQEEEIISRLRRERMAGNNKSADVTGLFDQINFLRAQKKGETAALTEQPHLARNSLQK